jgi:hypothetical protein
MKTLCFRWAAWYTQFAVGMKLPDFALFLDTHSAPLGLAIRYQEGHARPDCGYGGFVEGCASRA